MAKRSVCALKVNIETPFIRGAWSCSTYVLVLVHLSLNDLVLVLHVMHTLGMLLIIPYRTVRSTENVMCSKGHYATQSYVRYIGGHGSRAQQLVDCFLSPLLFAAGGGRGREGGQRWVS